jgi:hypothetical protein
MAVTNRWGNMAATEPRREGSVHILTVTNGELADTITTDATGEYGVREVHRDENL